MLDKTLNDDQGDKSHVKTSKRKSKKQHDRQEPSKKKKISKYEPGLEMLRLKARGFVLGKTAMLPSSSKRAEAAPNSDHLADGNVPTDPTGSSNKRKKSTAVGSSNKKPRTTEKEGDESGGLKASKTDAEASKKLESKAQKKTVRNGDGNQKSKGKGKATTSGTGSENKNDDSDSDDDGPIADSPLKRPR
jgi:hypothetical protein